MKKSSPFVQRHVALITKWIYFYKGHALDFIVETDAHRIELSRCVRCLRRSLNRRRRHRRRRQIGTLLQLY